MSLKTNMLTFSAGNIVILLEQVIGCQPDNSKVMYESIQAGKVTHGKSYDTLSDGTAGDIEEGSVSCNIMTTLLVIKRLIELNGVLCHFQQYFSHITATAHIIHVFLFFHQY